MGIEGWDLEYVDVAFTFDARADADRILKVVHAHWDRLDCRLVYELLQ
jgi:hypothetical protein